VAGTARIIYMPEAIYQNSMDRGRSRRRAWRVCALAVMAAFVPVAAPQTPTATRPTKRIVFVGDSLVHRSAKDHGMLDVILAELTKRHPAFNYSLIDAGVNGDRIADIEERLDRDVLALRPNAVVLFWDSDVSDVDERRLKPPGVQQLRAAYEQSLRDVVNRLAASGPFVVVSGPTLIGERPRGHNKKDSQLDAYRRINRHVALSLGVRYVDTRRAFFARRPPGTPLDVAEGLLTEDGEHLNDRGTLLAGRLFAKALDGWLQRHVQQIPEIEDIGRTPEGGMK
jgi:lysophospholipase L1-like esterase